MTALASPPPGVRPPHDTRALGRRTGALTPGARSSLRTGAAAAGLLVATAALFGLHHRPWGLSLLAIVIGGLGLVLGSVALIELLPTPGHLTFYEHGFADARPDRTTDLYLDGLPVVHDVPSENLPRSARARRTTPSSIATR